MEKETKTYTCKKIYKNQVYIMTFEKPKDLRFTIYLSDYLFLKNLGVSKYALSEFFKHNGKPTTKCKKDLELIKVKSISNKEELNINNLSLRLNDKDKQMLEELRNHYKISTLNKTILKLIHTQHTKLNKGVILK